MQLNGICGGVKYADVVAVVVGVFWELAALVVDSLGGAVEEVLGLARLFGAGCDGAGVGR